MVCCKRDHCRILSPWSIDDIPILLTGASFTFIATKEVILAAGTIGTPHILLNSGIGDANELREVGVPPLLNAPHVGKGMSDHVSVLLSWTRSVSDPPLVESLLSRLFLTGI